MPEGSTGRGRGGGPVGTASGGTAGDAGRSRLPPWLARVRPASGRPGWLGNALTLYGAGGVHRRPRGLGGRTGRVSRTSGRAAPKSAAAGDQQGLAGRLAYCAIARQG